MRKDIDLKKCIAFIITFTFLIGLCSCKKDTVFEPSIVEVTEEQSIVSFNLYPKNDKFTFIDKFERAAYRQLTDKQKGIYILLDNAAFEMKNGYIKLGHVKESDIGVAFAAVRQDRPEYFWLPNSYTMRSIGDEKQISFTHNGQGWLCDNIQRNKQESQIRKMLAVYLGSVNKDATEYERELSAHDYLAKTAKYNKISLDDYNNNTASWNITGVFCNKKAVCEGYSRAMQVMSFMLGLDCSLVTGVTDEPHMWNVIKIDGEWYHLDLTANDSDQGPYHFFFNVTQKYLEESRTIDPKISDDFSRELTDSRYNIFLPDCTSEKYNYHIYNSLFAAEKSQVESMVVSTICEAVKDEKRMIELSVSGNTGFDPAIHNAEKYFDLGRCISIANAELPKNKRLRSYSYGSVTGAKGFIISW